jgi:hypothetical protein
MLQLIYLRQKTLLKLILLVNCKLCLKNTNRLTKCLVMGKMRT